MADMEFTKEDEFDPVYCAKCHKHIPRAAVDAFGDCPNCRPVVTPDSGSDAESVVAYAALQNAGLVSSSNSATSRRPVRLVWGLLCIYAAVSLLPMESHISSWLGLKGAQMELTFGLFLLAFLAILMLTNRRIASWLIWPIWWLLFAAGARRTLLIIAAVRAYINADSSRGGDGIYVVLNALSGVMVGVAVGYCLPKVSDRSWSAICRRVIGL